MARDTIVIRRPGAGANLKLGTRGDLVIDLTLARPWFAAPRYGQRIRTITGQSRRGLDFDLTGERPISSLTEGKAVAFDTRKDCYARSDTVGAGLGCYVVVTVGDLKLTYAHLKRGSARSGPVKVGERIGYAGNTGHCLDGDRKYFVHFEVSQGSTPRDGGSFAQPLDLVLLIDGEPIDTPRRVPEGLIELGGFDVGEWSMQPRRFSLGPHTLEVVLKEGYRVRAKAKQKIELVR